MDFNTTDLLNWFWDGFKPFFEMGIVILVVKGLANKFADKFIRG